MHCSLDFNLHQAILKSLATSFATSDAKSAKAAASGKAAANTSTDAVEALQSSYQDILDTVELTADVLEEKDNWTLCDANAVIALAEYATETAKAAISMKAQPNIHYTDGIQNDCQERLEKCGAYVRTGLGRLHMVMVERCLGGQGEGPGDI